MTTFTRFKPRNSGRITGEQHPSHPSAYGYLRRNRTSLNQAGAENLQRFSGHSRVRSGNQLLSGRVQDRAFTRRAARYSQQHWRRRRRWWMIQRVNGGTDSSADQDVAAVQQRGAVIIMRRNHRACLEKLSLLRIVHIRGRRRAFAILNTAHNQRSPIGKLHPNRTAMPMWLSAGTRGKHPERGIVETGLPG